MRQFLVLSIAILSLAVSQVRGADDTAAVRIRFGMKDTDNTDWSGTVTPSSGKVESIRGWRWMPGDKADGNSFTVMSRRQQAQSAAERKQVAAWNQMPMTDNGILVSMSAIKPDTEIAFDTKQAKATFKLAGVPYGKRLSLAEGNVMVERVPVASTVASSNEDEDYPAVATAKDGTLYLANLSFKHGKDFEGNRERPATPESAPNVGPLAVGEVRHIEKPDDFDYLAQPTEGEQVYLRIYRNGAWGEPVAVTDGKLELYRPAIAVDGNGRVWVFYSAHSGADKNLDYGNWELMARSFDANGKDPREAVNVSQAEGADFMPAATTDSKGKVHVTWVGSRKTNFNIFAAAQEGDGFSKAQRVTQASGNQWEPAIVADKGGNVIVAWDSYQKGDYDVYCAKRGSDGKFAAPQAVAASLSFEVRPSMACDAQGQIWFAWEES